MSEAQAPAAFLEVPATSCLGGDGRRYWAILSSLLDPLVVMQSVRDADRVLWISPSVEGVLGWPVGGCIGRDALDFIATHESQKRYIDSKKRVAAGLRAVVRVQLLDAGGQPHWAEVRSSPFRASDGSISGMVSTTRIIDTEVRAEETLERRARTDDLTGLFSRTEVMERLDQLVTHASRDTAVLWCDIDRFKVINDIHGHVVGDNVLRTLAARAMACGAVARLMVGRVGGDEMMAVVPDVRELRDACMAAEELRRRAADPIPLADGVVWTTLSIGVTLASPGESIDAVLARADDAMYRAKSGGRNRVVAVPPPAIPRPR